MLEKQRLSGGCFTYLDLRKKKSGGNRRTEHEVKSVEFRNVSFCYPGSGKYALQNISICLKPASSYAVVGMNGSGKSTVYQAFMPFVRAHGRGNILNGKNIREYEQGEYFRLISVVFQDFNLFFFSLGANVAASPGYDAKKVADCLDKAGFSHLEKKMTGGLENHALSGFHIRGRGSERRRGAENCDGTGSYKNAPIMILDEPTAALDPVSEAESMNVLLKSSGGKWRFIFRTAFPHVNFAITFWYSMRAGWYSGGLMRSW